MLIEVIKVNPMATKTFTWHEYALAIVVIILWIIKEVLS
jgi:hypothetical protein